MERGETDEWAALDATAQAELVASGRASPAELIEAAIRRISRVDVDLGAVPVRFFEHARHAAGGVPAGARFAGVPFLMKDVGARQRGQPYYAANRALREADHRADSDTPLGARFREIGLVTLGNSSTPEFGLQSNTWPIAYGPTRNPWDPWRAAGGSSGGACAAVAAGLVPVAHASDGAGSIRIPAAWCGLVGLKPTRDRVIWRHAGHDRPEVEFVVARSLRDTAHLLDALRPREARRAEPSRFAGSLDETRRGLRVGFCLRSPAGSEVAASCADAVVRAVTELERIGHRVSEDAPAALDHYEERALFGAVLGPLGYRECLDELEQRLGRRVAATDVEAFLWELAADPAEAREGVSPGDIERATRWTLAWKRTLLGWFEHSDLLVTPTVHEPAPPLDSLDPGRLAPMELLERMIPHMAFTEPWNTTGQPAITLPLGWSPEGLPVGVQLVGRPGAEDDLLAVSARLLEALGDPGRRPRIHA
jgi:amidase